MYEEVRGTTLKYEIRNVAGWTKDQETRLLRCNWNNPRDAAAQPLLPALANMIPHHRALLNRGGTEHRPGHGLKTLSQKGKRDADVGENRVCGKFEQNNKLAVIAYGMAKQGTSR